MLSLGSTAACAAGPLGSLVGPGAPPDAQEVKELSQTPRGEVLRRAHVWKPIDTARLNLLAGPAGTGSFPFDAAVTCDYHYPDEPVGGVTPKFECEFAPKDIAKVKYGADNGEVYAEVAGTRLFWALGFLVDRMYPVRVTCHNCPADPFRESKAEWHLGRSGSISTKIYDPAVVEREAAGEEIKPGDTGGWSWDELELIDPRAGGAPRAHVDALKLLAAFVQHVDNKRDNQAVVCPEDAVRKDRDGDETCAVPMLMVKDLGSSFAAASKMRFPKMKLDSWSDVPIWKDPAACQADLTGSLVGTLEHPRISEAGRKFLADRLMLLSDRQIRDLFTASRVERRGDTIRDENGQSRPVTVDDWVRVFKDKRDQIVKHRCPAAATLTRR
jgi:hypothetical protein